MLSWISLNSSALGQSPSIVAGKHAAGKELTAFFYRELMLPFVGCDFLCHKSVILKNSTQFFSAICGLCYLVTGYAGFTCPNRAHSRKLPFLLPTAWSRHQSRAWKLTAESQEVVGWKYTTLLSLKNRKECLLHPGIWWVWDLKNVPRMVAFYKWSFTQQVLFLPTGSEKLLLYLTLHK